ncbi:MAG: ion transporter [Chitinophagaceae bacterium]|nr:ion transporter [Chitinophagaceae bacterium]MCB0740084.1 ion transporter [Chitinophagaceae bacterium]HQV06540.1 ion transporter [Chitinophagaceae bacterium]
MYKASKKKVHSLLHPEIVGNKRWDKIINIFIIVLIILNVIAVMLETVPSLHDEESEKQFFHYFDVVSVIIFTVEYILRVWSSNLEDKYKHSVWGRLRYMASPAALIDLLAILPFYIHVVVGLDLRVLRILRLMRIFRLFRLTAYTRSAHMIKRVFKKRFHDLSLSFILVVFLIILASCAIYFAEHEPPGNSEKFTSIPATIWWAVVTLTTTGYGDMVPFTTLGKSMTVVIMLTGVAFFALPAGIITAGFLEEFRMNRVKKTHQCPYCGEHIELDDLENHESNHDK